MKKNLVVITFAHVVEVDSVFSPHQRFLQVLQSIQSIRQKIPNSYITLLEIGSSPDEYVDFMTKCVDEYHNMNVKGLCKNRGEATMLYKYLSSENFQSKKHQFETISKLSGRYLLTDNFDFFKYPIEKPLIKSRFFPDGGVHYETRYYRIPGSFIDTFYTRLHDFFTNHNEILDQNDVEHIFYDFGILKLDESVHDVHIGVGGQVSGRGNLIED